MEIRRYEPSKFWPTGFDTIDIWFEQFCEANRIDVVQHAASRHGSWEWMGAREDTLTRFLTFGLTPLGSPSGAPATYEAEFWSGARSPHRFVRKLVHHAEISEESFENAEFQLWFRQQLDVTWKRSLSLRARQLTDTLSPLAPT